VSVDGRLPIDEVESRSIGALDAQAQAPDMVTASHARRSSGCARPAASSRRRWRAWRQPCTGRDHGQLDRIAERCILDAGMTPSFKDYLGNGVQPGHRHAYPATTCISLDDEVVHGIPGERVIEDGTIVSVDMRRDPRGLARDAARTWVVGSAPDTTRRSSTPPRARSRRHRRRGPGNHVRDISAAIEDVATPGTTASSGVRGHGIGSEMHQDRKSRTTARATRAEARAGLCLAIEPMLTLGTTTSTSERRVDRRRPRRQPRRPLRGHDRDHGPRPEVLTR
jgi:methionine aminopeptidase